MVAVPSSLSSPTRHGRLIAVGAALALLAAPLVATPAHAETSRSIFAPTDRPATAAVSSGKTANIGVRFSTATSGVITAVKFYRGPRQTKAYVASIWSSKSKRLAKVTFRALTTVGWQTATLRKPVTVKSKTAYFVSYLATGGHYPVTKGAFSRSVSRDGITVAKSGGRYTVARTSKRPTHSTKTNYFVDVVFVPKSSTISATELQAAAAKRVFFGHHSVGWNVLEGVSSLYGAAGIAGPAQVQLSGHGDVISPAGGGVLAHAEAGENGNPDGKVDDFAAFLRGGVAGQVKVAVVKYCYVDIYDDSTVDATFAHYVAVMDGLHAEFPGITFIHATNPLEADSDGANRARYRFNQLVRAKYAGTGRLWDIAAIESTRPDGTRVTGSAFGEAMYAGYTSDGGHLNAAGSQVVASALLRLIAAS
ncbi:MAG: hypothetical protein CVT62_08315 [Actinobacteria bacterium HGW-Actinobacteria-2]|nr:MAG: hypothetical protein CVT62_08315 [Actinobacteria bacterium HGW-Actinobacteria-2]